jgi:hypothetical protein
MIHKQILAKGAEFLVCFKSILTQGSWGCDNFDSFGKDWPQWAFRSKQVTDAPVAVPAARVECDEEQDPPILTHPQCSPAGMGRHAAQNRNVRICSM